MAQENLQLNLKKEEKKSSSQIRQKLSADCADAKLKPWGKSGGEVERFWKKVNKIGSIPTHMKHLGNCWEWIGSLASGYGQSQMNGKPLNAHRVSWIMANGKIETGKWILHHCDNRACVRPSHLFCGTPSDNVIDLIKKGRDRSVAHINRLKTHCKNGHEFNKENTIIRTDKSSKRRCKICRDINQKRYDKIYMAKRKLLANKS